MLTILFHGEAWIFMTQSYGHYSAYRKNIASQFGEDGILEHVFHLIGTKNKWCVEFGAHNGKTNSNTWHLLNNRGWSGVLIESDDRRYKICKATHAKNKAVVINKFVNFKGPNSLDNILKTTKIPKDFDLLSIDIDGNDYHIWGSLRKYKPRVVIIEFNDSIPSDVEFIQEKNMDVQQGTSVLSIVKLARKKGYELAYAHRGNAVFVRREIFPALGISDNGLETLYTDHDHETRIFQLYDGTLVTIGNRKLLWCGAEFGERDLQVLPKHLRGFANNRKTLMLLLYRALRLQKPHIKLKELVDKKKIDSVLNNLHITKIRK